MITNEHEIYGMFKPNSGQSGKAWYENIWQLSQHWTYNDDWGKFSKDDNAGTFENHLKKQTVRRMDIKSVWEAPIWPLKRFKFHMQDIAVVVSDAFKVNFCDI